MSTAILPPRKSLYKQKVEEKGGGRRERRKPGEKLATEQTLAL